MNDTNTDDDGDEQQTEHLTEIRRVRRWGSEIRVEDKKAEGPATYWTTDRRIDLRGDLVRMVREIGLVLERECPADDCEGETQHTIYGGYPAVATTGAWGKYLNPAYRCEACGHVHTLLSYETPEEYREENDGRAMWGEYPPENDDVDEPETASRLVQERAERRDSADEEGVDA